MRWIFRLHLDTDCGFLPSIHANSTPVYSAQAHGYSGGLWPFPACTGQETVWNRSSGLTHRDRQPLSYSHQYRQFGVHLTCISLVSVRGKSHSEPGLIQTQSWDRLRSVKSFVSGPWFHRCFSCQSLRYCKSFWSTTEQLHFNPGYPHSIFSNSAIPGIFVQLIHCTQCLHRASITMPVM